jgi:hypothetical protein
MSIVKGTFLALDLLRTIHHVYIAGSRSAGSEVERSSAIHVEGLIDREQPDAYKVFAADFLEILGRVHQKLFQYNEALVYFNRCLTLRRILYGHQHLNLAKSLYNIGAYVKFVTESI